MQKYKLLVFCILMKINKRAVSNNRAGGILVKINKRAVSNTLGPLIVVPPQTPNFEKNYHPFPFIDTPP